MRYQQIHSNGGMFLNFGDLIKNALFQSNGIILLSPIPPTIP